MITLHETHFLLIIVLVTLITYTIYSYYLDCNIDCKINYYKYENYHDKKKEPQSQNVHQIMAKDTDHDNNLRMNPISNIINLTDEKTYIDNTYDLPIKDNNGTSNIGDRTSSHSGSIQSTAFDGYRNDDIYIKKLCRGLY